MQLISGRPALDRLRPGVVELSLALLLGGRCPRGVVRRRSGAGLGADRRRRPDHGSAGPHGAAGHHGRGYDRGLAAAGIIGLPFGELLIPGFAPLLAVYSVGVQSTARGLITAALIGFAAFAIAVAADPTPDSPTFCSARRSAALAVGRAVRVMGFETRSRPAPHSSSASATRARGPWSRPNRTYRPRASRRHRPQHQRHGRAGGGGTAGARPRARARA